MGWMDGLVYSHDDPVFGFAERGDDFGLVAFPSDLSPGAFVAVELLSPCFWPSLVEQLLLAF